MKLREVKSFWCQHYLEIFGMVIYSLLPIVSQSDAGGTLTNKIPLIVFWSCAYLMKEKLATYLLLMYGYYVVVLIWIMWA